MRILYIHQYFVSPRSEGGTRSYEMAKYLVQRGHEVTVITSGLKNQEFPVERDKGYTEYDVDGIRLIAIRGGYNDGRVGTAMSGWRRVLAFYRFAQAASVAGMRVERPDIVFATHTPLMVGYAGEALGRYFARPFVFEVRDLWPEALVNIGVLRNPFVIMYLRALAKRFYDGADHIIAASPGMKDGIVKYGISERKVTVVTNAADLQMFSPGKDGGEERQRLGLGDRLAVIYFGAMGIANGLDYVLDAAAELQRRGRRDIVIVLHGSGGKRPELERRVAIERLDNVIFSDPVPEKARLSAIVAACDVCMTIYRATRETTWSPNKFFDSLAAGKPVVVNVPGWLGETVTKNNCGFQCAPDDPSTLCEALARLAEDPDLRKKFGENARRLAEKQFSRESQAGRLEAVFKKMAS